MLGRAIHGAMPVQGETLEELSGPLVHTNFPRKRYGPIIGPYEFPPKFAWTNGAQSSLKVSLDRHWSIECSSLQWRVHNVVNMSNSLFFYHRNIFGTDGSSGQPWPLHVQTATRFCANSCHSRCDQSGHLQNGKPARRKNPLKMGKKMENGPRPEMAKNWPPKWKNGQNPILGFIFPFRWPFFGHFGPVAILHFLSHFQGIFASARISNSVDGHSDLNTPGIGESAFYCANRRSRARKPWSANCELKQWHFRG